MFDTTDAPVDFGPTAGITPTRRYSLALSRLATPERSLESHVGQAPSSTATHIGPSQASSRKFASFFAKAAFQGVVTEIDEHSETFSARLWHMSGYVPEASAGPTADADGTFPIESVSADDRPLVSVGSVFTWLTGYREGAGMPREWVSSITFRRLPARSEADMKSLDEGSDAYLRLFDER